MNRISTALADIAYELLIVWAFLGAILFTSSAPSWWSTTFTVLGTVFVGLAVYRFFADRKA
jgi:hypothetical protein